MNKRKFLKHILAASSIGMSHNVVGMPFIKPLGKTPDGLISHVVYDARFDEAKAFAEYFDGQGVATHAPQDMLHLWYGVLRKELRVGIDRVAGLTTVSDFMFVESTAREFGFKVLYKGLHMTSNERTCVHDLNCAPSLLSGLQRDMKKSDGHWPVSLASSLYQHLSDIENIDYKKQAQVQFEDIAMTDNGRTLISWVLG